MLAGGLFSAPLLCADLYDLLIRVGADRLFSGSLSVGADPCVRPPGGERRFLFGWMGLRDQDRLQDLMFVALAGGHAGPPLQLRSWSGYGGVSLSVVELFTGG